MAVSGWARVAATGPIDRDEAPSAGVGNLGEEFTATIEFRVSEWLGRTNRTSIERRPRSGAFLTRPPGARVVCVYGTDDADSVCPTVTSARVQVAVLPGGHHFGGDFARLAAVVPHATRGRAIDP